MGTLDKKLFRDLVRVWGQAIAIALVFGAGVATLVLASGAYKSLQETQTAYYERYRFADIFATARRVPAHVADRIALIPGVLAAQKRIQSTALLDIKGMSQPATGLIISLPRFGQPLVNTLYLREGRLPDPLHDVEIVVNESFAKAHALRPGSKLTAILNGRKKSLRIVGVALSPEFVYALGPGDLVPDNRRFAIIWMGETAAEAAFDLKGAFNSVAIKLMRNVRPERVLDQLDGLLADYGGRGGYLRKDQQSHAFIDAELQQLRAMSRVVPPIFLAVAAFMINMTLARLVAMERQQIGLLKALGYSNFSVALHYLKFVSVIAVLGIAIGMVGGVWLGRGLTRLYGEFYHFPFLVFTNSSDVFVIAGAVGIVSAWFGAGQAIVSVLALLPAAAMSPPRPTLYRRSLGKHAGWTAGMSQLSMMIVRHLIRFPIRASLTILGISASGALLVMSLSTIDSIEEMIDITYFQSSRQDITIGFDNLKPESIALQVRRLPGVLRAEPYRAIPVILRNGNRSKRVVIQAIKQDADLQQLLALDLTPLTVPEIGLAVSEKLAKILGVGLGDMLWVETKDHRRRTFRLPVTAIQQGYLGLMVHANYEAMSALMGDGRGITSIDLAIDPNHRDALYQKLKTIPSIGSVMLLRTSLKTFRDTLARNIHTMMIVYVLLAVLITFGVVYNAARIQLSERARELASLRVLGFTRAEVSTILLGEIGLMVAIAVPISFGLGYLFTYLLVSGFDTEIYRMPLIISRATYGWAATIVIATAIVSALLVRRRIDNFDLPAVLKTRE